MDLWQACPIVAFYFLQSSSSLLKLFFLSARPCSFLVRDVGALGPDGVLEVSSVMVIMAEMVIKVAMVNVVMMVIVMVAMVVMLVMTKKMLKSNHDNVL